MNIAVVGGGFSGAMTALALARQGHAVTIYEAGTELGGIVRDVHLPHGRFLRGCHYMNLAPSFQALWPHIDDLALTRFDHHYGSWNNLFGPVMVHHDFAQPVVPGPLGDGAATGDTTALWAGSVADYLALHEPRVGRVLTTWAERVGDVHSLAAINAIPLQLSRVFYPDDLAAVRAAKQADALLDSTLGVPRSLFEPPLPVQGGALPTHGFDDYMRCLQATLDRLGVRTMLNAPVKPVRQADDRCGLSLRGEAVAADWVVWCANPTPLLQVLTGDRLESPATRCVYLYATVNGALPEQPLYYQAFGHDHPVMRLFSYELGGRKLTIEALDEGWTPAQLVATTEQILRDLGWPVRVTHAEVQPEKRYALVSQHDLTCMTRFARKAARLGVVTGGWQHYGRDRRFGDILDQLTQVGLL